MGKGVEFLTDTAWLTSDYATRDILFDGQLCKKLACTIVGTVVGEDLKMEPHGNFDPTTNGNLSDALLKFKLMAPPPIYPVYQKDFQSGLHCLQDLVHALCDSTSTSQVIEVNHIFSPVALVITHPIFKAKVSFFECTIQLITYGNLPCI